jgi:hypothetical protein
LHHLHLFLKENLFLDFQQQLLHRHRHQNNLEMDSLLRHSDPEVGLLEEYYPLLDLKKGFVLLHHHQIHQIHLHCLEVFLLFLHHLQLWMLLLKIRMGYHFPLLHLERFYLILHLLL